jgi:archaemetzincin
MQDRFIYIAGFGVEKRLLFATAKNVKEVFGYETRVSHISLPPKLGYNAMRGQYRGEEVLGYLSRIYYPNMLKLVALIAYDLYEEGLNFIFGLAQLGGSCAVVSTYRLKDTREEVFLERVLKETNHELGHTFGLMHCRDSRCVMSFSNSLLDVDAKSRFFCESCIKILPKP